MKLSTKSRYAARLMVNLAWNYEKGPVQLNEIARREDISEKYLSQIVITLRGAGLIQSVRGARGGYLLGRKPAEISLADIVEVMEGGLSIVNCLVEESRCDRSESCITRYVWDKVSLAVRKTLEEITLEELAGHVGRSDAPMFFI